MVVTFDYGWDAQKSRYLTIDLDIEANFFWFSKSPRKKVLKVVNACDLVVVELQPQPVVQSGTILEALALGKPLVQARTDMKLKPGMDLPPVSVANDLDELIGVLKSFSENREPFVIMAEHGKSWRKKWVESESISLIADLIKSKVYEKN